MPAFFGGNASSYVRVSAPRLRWIAGPFNRLSVAQVEIALGFFQISFLLPNIFSYMTRYALLQEATIAAGPPAEDVMSPSAS
jgi:hypothetical protein